MSIILLKIPEFLPAVMLTALQCVKHSFGALEIMFCSLNQVCNGVIVPCLAVTFVDIIRNTFNFAQIGKLNLSSR